MNENDRSRTLNLLQISMVIRIGSYLHVEENKSNQGDSWHPVVYYVVRDVCLKGGKAV